jgi:hypothetical protein
MKNLEQEYYDSYRKPNLWVKLLVGIGYVVFVTILLLLVYGVVVVIYKTIF